MDGLPKSHYYVSVSNGDNFAVDEVNAEKITQALITGAKGVELVDVLDTAQVLNIAHLVKMSESTKEIRERSFAWNRACDEETAERRRKYGPNPLDSDI